MTARHGRGAFVNLPAEVEREDGLVVRALGEGPPAALGDIDASMGRAPFRQIADHLRASIASGALRIGDQLPSEAQFLQHYGVARATVRQALSLLRTEGLLVARHGKGVFVAQTWPPTRLLSNRGFRSWMSPEDAFATDMSVTGGAPVVERAKVAQEVPPDEVQERLGLEAGAQVVVRRRRYCDGERPVHVATTFVPLALADTIGARDADTRDSDLHAGMQEAGYRVTTVREEALTRLASEREAQLLDLPEAAAIVEIIRTARTDVCAVEVAVILMPAGAFTLRSDFVRDLQDGEATPQ